MRLTTTTRKRRSNGYGNYRHQADACHAYQIAKRKGIPEKADHPVHVRRHRAQHRRTRSRARSSTSPTARTFITAARRRTLARTFPPRSSLAVLTGDKKTAKGPVLRSSKRDNVFIYYADHGAPGLIAMPEDQEPVYAKDLNAALVEMKEKDMYNRLVFYLEACESGSMFKVRTQRGK